MPQTLKSTGYLVGQLLIAMPQMQDPRFARSVVYLCAHSADGAMGLVINRQFVGLSFSDLMAQLHLTRTPASPDVVVHAGGPVEPGRGFVLHSLDYRQDATLVVAENIGLTATIDMLRAVAEGRGPQHCLLALGYCGWAAGQLEAEMRDNAWLNAPADLPLLFDRDLDGKWARAIAGLGINLPMLSAEAGHA